MNLRQRVRVGVAAEEELLAVADHADRERVALGDRDDRVARSKGVRSCEESIASTFGPAMPTRTGKHTATTHGDVLTAISEGMVTLLKEFYGRWPTRTKTYYEDDLVLCLLRGGFSRVEQTLLEGGRGSSVIQQRMDFQDLMRERFNAVIEDATGRQVIGFMSGNQQNPDIMCEVFILSGTDLVDDEIPERERSSEG